jgi:hypothetical protein
MRAKTRCYLCANLQCELHMIVLAPSKSASAEELQRLGDEIAELSAHVHAAMYTLLVRLREFDQKDGWSRGFRSCAHWLSWRTGIAPGAAREKVRVARALDDLPKLSDAMRRGEFSFAKVRALTRVATPGNESELVQVARHATAAQLEKIVRGWRRADRLEEQRIEQRQRNARFLTISIDEDGMYEIRGRLQPEVGALLRQALEAGVEGLYGRKASNRGDPPPSSPASATPAQRRADAIGLLAERALVKTENDESGTSPIRPFEIIVHVDEQALATGSTEGQSVLSDGVHVSAETSRRLACDTARRVMTHDRTGMVVDVGRRTRAVSSALRTALKHRDDGCRFPGCGLRYCDAHHIVHWAEGGPTALENLVMLCRFHHRCVHEEGYRIERLENGELRFYAPAGWVIPNTPEGGLVRSDPVAALKKEHEQQGLEIDGETTTPHWHGERLDLHWAVLTLRTAGLPHTEISTPEEWSASCSTDAARGGWKERNARTRRIK